MNYITHYDRLIERARSRTLEDYCERHHIIPKCMGGDNSPENLVDLTAEEHFVAHLLLIKIHKNVKDLITAAVFMSKKCTGNKMYGWLRRKHANAMLGNKFMIGRTLSIETREKMSFIRRGRPGKKHTEETKIKLRQRIKHIPTQEQREKSIQILKERYYRPVIHLGYGFFFDSAKEAAQHFGIPVGSIYGMLSGKYPNNTLLRFADNITVKKQMPNKLYRPVVHIGYGILFDTVSEAAEFFGVLADTLRSQLRRGRNKTMIRYA